MKVIPGPASLELGEKIAELSGLEKVNVAYKVFPDGENYIRLEGSVQKAQVAIVQTTSAPQDTNLMQLALNARLGAAFSNDALVTLLYQNLLGAMPSQADTR